MSLIRRSKKSIRSRKKTKDAKIDYSSLEPRLALTTFIVTGALDGAGDSTDGVISLREAITAANTNAAFGDAPAGSLDGDIIRFDSSLANTTITLSEGELTVSDDLLIQAGANNITIDAGGSNRAFSVTSDEAVGLGGLNFVGGNAAIGGAISSVGSGTTIVTGSNFTSNESTGLGGGAIYHETGTLAINESVFTSNVASGSSGSGGAILTASGTAIVLDSQFVTNSANRAGGAIEVIDGETFISDSTIGGEEGAGNITGPDGSAAPGNGGGLHVTGSALVAINNTEVSYNFAASEGGGLWNQVGSRMFVNNGSSITDNLAAGSEADTGGGGIFNNGGSLYVTDSTISNNDAVGTSGSGGGILSTDGIVLVFDSTIDGNSAPRAGGGVEIIDGFNLLSNVELTGNDAGVSTTAAPGNGGGLHVTGVADIVVTGGVVSANVAASEGGGLWNQSGSRMFVREDAMIIDNVAQGDSADAGGGGIYNNGGAVFVTSSTVSDNSATGTLGSGGGIFSTDGQFIARASTIDGNAAARAGGGLEIIDGFSLLVETTFSNNDAGVSVAAAPGNGGGVHITGEADVIVEGGSFNSNTAANEGGGFWNQVGSNAFFTDSVSFVNNLASGGNAAGGGIYNKGFLRSTDTAFSQNRGNLLGGAIFAEDTARTILVSNTLTGNSAGDSGGGFYNVGSARVETSNFTANVAANDGGAIFTDPTGNTELIDNAFSSNLPNDFN